MRDVRFRRSLKRERRLFQIAAAVSMICSASATAGESEPYSFEEGEPLTYTMEIVASNGVATVAKFYNGTDKSANEGGMKLNIDYQLMPIARNERGEWKIRVVLNQIRRTTDRDGESKQENYDRSALRTYELNTSDIARMRFESSLPRQSEPNDGVSTNGPPPALLHAPEDLFDEPILAWIAPNGSLVKFEDRTELKQVMPGINLKECLDLTLPPLPAVALEPGATWTRELPVDVPEEPLPGYQYPAMIMKLSYTVKPPAKADGTQVRIALQGRFVRDGLSVPIDKHEMNYLVWTTSVTKIDDQIVGEFLYDPERHAMTLAQIVSTYRYNTLAGRKVDNYRGRITSEKVSHTRLVAKSSQPLHP
jgi:hypothetical protein